MHAVQLARSVGLGSDDLALALLELSGECIKILDIDGHLGFINCGGLQALEIDDPTGFIGKEWWGFWPEESREFVRQQFTNALTGKVCTFEADCPTARGAHRRWAVTLKPMLGQGGAVLSVICVSKDVTAQAA